MSKRLPCLLSLFALSLLSCGAKSPYQLDEERFPFTDDPDLAYIVRNGDNYTKDSASYSYSEMTVKTSLDIVSERLENNQPVLLFLHMDTCKTCQAVHDVMAHLFLSSGMLVHEAYFISGRTSETLNMLNSIGEKYPTLYELFHNSYVTPSMFLLYNTEKGVPVSFLDKKENQDELDEFFRGLLNLPLLYEFTSYASYDAFAKNHECLTYFDDGDGFYYQNVYPRAIHKKLYTARINIEGTSSSDLALFQKRFGSDDLIHQKNGKDIQAIDVEKDAASATSLLNAYYA